MRPQLSAERGNSVVTSTLLGTQTECVLEIVPPHFSILSSMHGIDLRMSAICDADKGGKGDDGGEGGDRA